MKSLAQIALEELQSIPGMEVDEESFKTVVVRQHRSDELLHFCTNAGNFVIVQREGKIVALSVADYVAHKAKLRLRLMRAGYRDPKPGVKTDVQD